jgi:hypothetical protein
MGAAEAAAAAAEPAGPAFSPEAAVAEAAMAKTLAARAAQTIMEHGRSLSSALPMQRKIYL